MNVFCYVRVSTENQLENYSIEEQTKRLQAYCLAKGWNILKVYTDGGFSGGNLNRPALNMMLHDLHHGAAQAVVVYKLDRLSRSQKDTLTLIEDEFEKKQIAFVSISENFDTSTPFGRAMIGMLSVFAQLEKDQIVERFTMGRIGRSKAGYFHGGGNAPHGYRYENGRLVVEESTAALVQEVYRSFLDGKSIHAIHQNMVRRGVPWSARAVMNMLKNSVYIGKVKFQGKEYPGLHAPIVSGEQYQAVQAILQSSGREQKKNTAQKTPFRAGYLLSSLIFCERCGARYSANHGYYKCYSRSKSSRKFIKDPACKNDNWEISELDQHVIQAVQNLIHHDDILKQVLQASPVKEPTMDEEMAERQIAEIDRQLARVIELYQLDTIPMEEVAKRTRELSAKKELLQNQGNRKGAAANRSQAAFLESIRQFDAHFFDAPTERKRLLISSLIESIRINGDQIAIHGRIGS